MNWYRVIKTIKGRRYAYWQKTYRIGKQVKTLNRYIGPAAGSSSTAEREPLWAGQFEIPRASQSSTGTRKPLNITLLKKEKKAVMEALYFNPDAFDRVQDELEYAYAVKTDREKKRGARRKAKGIKSLNTFMAQALLKD